MCRASKRLKPPLARGHHSPCRPNRCLPVPVVCRLRLPDRLPTRPAELLNASGVGGVDHVPFPCSTASRPVPQSATSILVFADFLSLTLRESEYAIDYEVKFMLLVLSAQ